MATKISLGTPGNEYVVIDNGAANANTLNAGATIGYDTVTTGAASQNTNPLTNGTIPDAVNTSTVVLNSPLSTRLLFKNPA